MADPRQITKRPLPDAEALRAKNERRRQEWLIPESEIVSRKDAETLAAIAGQIAQEQIDQLHVQLNEVAELLRGQDILEGDVLPWREVRKALKARIKAWSKALQLMDEGDPVTRGLLGKSYAQFDAKGNEVPGRQEARDADIASARRLHDQLVTTQDRVPTQGGAPDLGVLHSAAEKFAKLFEETCGTRFTFDYDPRPDGNVWMSSGAAFVAQAIQITFPSTTDSNLVTVMKGAVTNRRHWKKPRPKTR